MQHHGGGGKGQLPPKGFKERKIRKCGVFSYIEVIKIGFFVILNKEIHAL